MTRQIILDTETTGLSPEQGHRIIEIGCVELINRRLTGEVFQTYLNPDRGIEPGAVAVHGITESFLKDKPKFFEIMNDFLRFIQDAELIIHNAPFDLGFLDNELKLVNDQSGSSFALTNPVVDTLALARKKHPGQRNNLDALCKRYQINNKHRHKHGALLDAEILADVYLVMTGGQSDLALEQGSDTEGERISQERYASVKIDFPIVVASAKEQENHREYLEKMKATYFADPHWEEAK